jgi:hypothetical protein
MARFADEQTNPKDTLPGYAPVYCKSIKDLPDPPNISTPKKHYNGVDPIELGEIVWVADIDNLRTAKGRIVNVEKLSYDATGYDWAFKIDVGYNTKQGGYVYMGEECYLELTDGIFFTEKEADEYLRKMLECELGTFCHKFDKIESEKTELEQRKSSICTILKSPKKY